MEELFAASLRHILPYFTQYKDVFILSRVSKASSRAIRESRMSLSEVPKLPIEQIMRLVPMAIKLEFLEMGHLKGSYPGVQILSTMTRKEIPKRLNRHFPNLHTLTGSFTYNATGPHVFPSIKTLEISWLRCNQICLMDVYFPSLKSLRLDRLDTSIRLSKEKMSFLWVGPSNKPNACSRIHLEYCKKLRWNTGGELHVDRVDFLAIHAYEKALSNIRVREVKTLCMDIQRSIYDWTIEPFESVDICVVYSSFFIPWRCLSGVRNLFINQEMQAIRGMPNLERVIYYPLGGRSGWWGWSSLHLESDVPIVLIVVGNFKELSYTPFDTELVGVSKLVVFSSNWRDYRGRIEPFVTVPIISPDQGEVFERDPDVIWCRKKMEEGIVF